jgi:hypothetical protein
MKRLVALLVVSVLVFAACGDDEAAVFTTTSTTVTTVAPTTTALVTTTTTSTIPPTTTTFVAPPSTAVDPELTAYAGLWRWPDTHSRYLQLLDHGVLAVGDIVDDSLELNWLGEWTVRDQLMEIRFLQIGGTCPNEAVGYYEVTVSSSRLDMRLVTDECDNRSRWLIGVDRTQRTWIAVGN